MFQELSFFLSKNFYYLRSTLNPLQPNVSMHILHTVLYTFPIVLAGTIRLTIKRLKILDIWKFHIFALWWKDEIRRSLQLRTLLKRVVVNRTWKKFRPIRDLNPWPLRYRCSAPPIEPTSQPGAGQWIRYK